MSLQILSVASPLVSLFFFSAFVVAGINVTAGCLPSFSWAFNSLGQSPCTVAAYMLATCYSGSYTLIPLQTGYAYGGPRVGYSNKCECSTVGYSLITACVICQDRPPFYWSAYVVNCSSTLPPSQFPNPVPEGTRVPHWAILDVTNENVWNANESYAAGDNPEYGPGAIFGASGVYTGTSSAAASSTGSPSLTPPSKGKSSIGPIVGGVVGGIAIISIAVAAIFYLRWRRSQAVSAGIGASQPKSDNGSGAVAQPSFETPPVMRIYDPDDPTTFPGHQGSPRSLEFPPNAQVPLLSHVGSGSVPEDMQTSLPHARGYHGLPMPSA